MNLNINPNSDKEFLKDFMKEYTHQSSNIQKQLLENYSITLNLANNVSMILRSIIMTIS